MQQCNNGHQLRGLSLLDFGFGFGSAIRLTTHYAVRCRRRWERRSAKERLCQSNASRYYTHKVQDISSHQIYIVLAPEWGQRKNKQNLRNMRFCITRCLSVLYLKVSRSEDMLSTIFFFLRAACIAINKNQSDPKKETLLAHRRRGDQLYLSRSLSGYEKMGTWEGERG